MQHRSIHTVLAQTVWAMAWLGACTGYAATPASRSGEAVYAQYCAICHDQTSPRVPPRASLQALSPARILRALDAGVMMSVAYPLRRDQRAAVASFLGKANADSALPASAYCQERDASLSGPGASWNGWSPAPTNTRYQSAEQAGLSAAIVPTLKLKWAFGFPGDITAYGAPSVVSGVLFAGSAGGFVYALSARSGCVHWTFTADGPVRSAPVVVRTALGDLLLFGDQIGWFYALDAQTGRLRWKHRIDRHEATRLTGSPVVHDGVVFVPAASWEETRALSDGYPCCTFRGSVSALRIADGVRLWKTSMVGLPRRTGVTRSGTASFGPSGAGVWAAVTLDAKRGALYVATGDNYSQPVTPTSDAIVALQLKTGRILWVRQVTANDAYTSACKGHGPNCPKNNGPDFDLGASAILVSAAGHDVLIAGQKSGILYALNPDHHGQILWQVRVGKGGPVGGVQWGMTTDEGNVYASVSDVVMKSNPIGAAPIGGADLDPTQGGGLTALRLRDGTQTWYAPAHPCNPVRPGCSPAQSAALTSIPGIVFSGSIDGHLRAFTMTDGKMVWDYDSVRDYSTVDGVAAKGGSMDGAGPVVVGGMLYVNSGYPRFGGMPGNVLLAFSRDGK
jgi:polyvinyl alcohol dehydrogenase (cytochrome)